MKKIMESIMDHAGYKKNEAKPSSDASAVEKKFYNLSSKFEELKTLAKNFESVDKAHSKYMLEQIEELEQDLLSYIEMNLM